MFSGLFFKVVLAGCVWFGDGDVFGDVSRMSLKWDFFRESLLGGVFEGCFCVAGDVIRDVFVAALVDVFGNCQWRQVSSECVSEDAVGVCLGKCRWGKSFGVAHVCIRVRGL